VIGIKADASFEGRGRLPILPGCKQCIAKCSMTATIERIEHNRAARSRYPSSEVPHPGSELTAEAQCLRVAGASATARSYSSCAWAKSSNLNLNTYASAACASASFGASAIACRASLSAFSKPPRIATPVAPLCSVISESKRATRERERKVRIEPDRLRIRGDHAWNVLFIPDRLVCL
jgi:hypothetical protein